MGFIRQNGEHIQDLSVTPPSGWNEAFSWFSNFNIALIPFSGRRVIWAIDFRHGYDYEDTWGDAENLGQVPTDYKERKLSQEAKLISGKWDEDKDGEPPQNITDKDMIFFIAEKKTGYYGVEGSVTYTTDNGAKFRFEFEVPQMGANKYFVRGDYNNKGYIVFPTVKLIDKEFVQYYETRILRFKK